MNITFLIGNGFDVGMGMNSRFSDFFPIYCADAATKKTSIKKLAEDIDQNQADWSYFERQIGRYTDKFTPDNKQELLDQFRDFELSFISYLKQEEECLSFSDSKKISRKVIDGLTKFYLGGNLQTASSDTVKSIFHDNRSVQHTYNFLCFNYTSVLENCLGTIPDGIVQTRVYGTNKLTDKIGKIVHVHGLSNSFPIMGVNDKSQITNQALADDAKFSRFLIKPKLNDIHRMNYDKDGSSLIFASDIICVYGMSIGETDKVWWERLLGWLNSGVKRQLVVFLYDKDYRTSTQFDWIQKEDSLIDTLVQSAPKGVNVENLRSRIHLAVHKNIFELNLRKDMAFESLKKVYTDIAEKEESNEEAKALQNAYLTANKGLVGSK